MIVLVYAHIHSWRPKVDIGYLPESLLFTLYEDLFY